MKICLIDDKLMENMKDAELKNEIELSSFYKAALELVSRYSDKFEYHEDFFPNCFDEERRPIKSEIISVLDEYNAIIFHTSKFNGRGVRFREIIKENGKECELIGFSGNLSDIIDFHSRGFNMIKLARNELYKKLESFVKDSMDRNIVNLDLILNN